MRNHDIIRSFESRLVQVGFKTTQIIIFTKQKEIASRSHEKKQRKSSKGQESFKNIESKLSPF